MTVCHMTPGHGHKTLKVWHFCHLILMKFGVRQSCLLQMWPLKFFIMRSQRGTFSALIDVHTW